MRLSQRMCRISFSLLTLTIAARVAQSQELNSGHGVVAVRANQLLRDGRPWIPHGFYQIAFEVAPGNLGRADHPFWANAYNHYTPDEYRDMREAGADSVRIQISQAAADPQSRLFDRAFLQKALDAVRAARIAGLTVMISVQDESHVPGERVIDLPDDGTRRVWGEIAPQFAGDHGVMYELLNEPRLPPNPQSWQRWQKAMMDTLRSIRRAGASNVAIADGLGVGQVIDGAPLLSDPQVVYASHPYALAAQGQTSAQWDAKFGSFSHRAPVIVTEWLSGGYFCDAKTAQSTVQFLEYLQRHSIGLEAGAWDWTSGGFGSVRYDFPNSQFSTFAGKSCHEKGFGFGQLVKTWYLTGTPAGAVE